MRAQWFGVFAAMTLCATIPAAAQPGRVLAGAWSGEYTCTQGLTGMTLIFRPGAGATIGATAVFFAHPDNPGVESGCYELRGVYERARGRFTLHPHRWVLRPNESWEMTSLEGEANLASGVAQGRIFLRERASGCTTFKIVRNARPFKPAPAPCVAPAATS